MQRCRISCLTLILITFTFYLGTIVTAQPTTWYPGDNLSETPWRSIEAALARDPVTGDLHVAWMERSDVEPGEVLGRRWDSVAQTWHPAQGSPAENLSASEWTDGGPALFLDHEGRVHLLWTRRYGTHQGAPEDGTDLLWRYWDGNAWSTEATLLQADSFFPGTYGLLPVPLSDSTLVFIVFGNGYRVIEYADGGWGEASSWTYLYFPGGIKPVLADMVVDGEGLIHAAAYADNSSQAGLDRWFYDGYYLTFDGTTWSLPVNLSSTLGVAHDVGLAFDGYGYLHFLWSDPNSRYSSESRKSAIWERVYNGDTWTANTETTSYRQNQVINTFSVRPDVNGRLHLAWSAGALVGGTQTAVGIYYQEGDGTQWGPEQAVQTGSGESWEPALDVTGADLHMIWQEGPNDIRDVYHSRLFEGHSAPVTLFLPLVRR